jgi:ubiquinone/menaquinone biosynthesis C-methylase UbiE
MSSRLEKEIFHSTTIKDDPEKIWGLSSHAGKLRAQRRAEMFIEKTGMNSTYDVLEIGCGSGIFTEKLSRTQARIIATDISEDLLALARRKNLPNCELRITDAHHLEFASNTFDVVYGSSILHHLDVEKALKEIFRVLKPRGQIIFSEPNMLNPIVMMIKNVGPLKKIFHESPDETAFFRWPLARQLRRIGFVNETITPYDFLHPSTPPWVIRFAESPLKQIEKIPLLKEFSGSLLIHARKS